jgi:hypothetical protein
MKRGRAYLDSLVLNMILEKLIKQIDHIWFGSFCKNWHLLANLCHQNDHEFKSDILPMLMIHADKSPEKRTLYSMFYKERCWAQVMAGFQLYMKKMS